MFMSKLLKVIHMSLWGVAWLIDCKMWEHEGCMQCVQQDALQEHNLLKFHTCKVCHALAWKHPLALHFFGTFI